MVTSAKLVVSLVFVMFGAVITLSQSQRCDPSIKTPFQNPLRYKLRGDRCEGILLEEFSGALEVVYFGFKPHGINGFQNHDALNLMWSSPEPLTLSHVRARGIRRDITNYQMDFPPQAVDFIGTTYTWPLNVIRALRSDLLIDDISLVAWTHLDNKRIYLPLSLHRKEERADSYFLELLPSSELIEVYVSLAIPDESGNPPQYLKYQEPLKLPSYPTSVRISIEFPFELLPEPGIYYVEVNARRNGGPAGLSLDFYHDGSRD